MHIGERSERDPRFTPASPEGDEDQTLVDRLERWSRELPDARAFTFLGSDARERETLTFGQLWQRSLTLAGTLAGILPAGDRAVLAFTSEREFIEAFFACQIAGIVAVPASMPLYRPGAVRLAAIASHVDSRAILTGLQTLDSFHKALGEAPGASKIRLIATSSLPPSQPGNFTSVHAQDVAMIQYTSGSTGAPKGIVLTHRNLMKNQALIERAFGHTANTIFAGVLPLFHDMGLIGNVLQPVYLGILSVLIRPAAFLKRPACWIQAISRYRVTTSGGPNFLFDTCVDRISDDELAGVNLSSWSVAFNGSEPVRAGTLDRFEERFREVGFRKSAFYPCYGLAEATLVVSGGPPQSSLLIRTVDRDALQNRRIQAPRTEGVRLVSCGLPAAADSVRIVDPERSHALGADEIGEIWVRSPSVASGYWNDASATADTFAGQVTGEPGAYLRTGDLGFLDADGALFVTGRCKDLIIVHGQNIYPHDVEETALAVDPRLARAAAFQESSEPAPTVLLIEPTPAAKRGFSGIEASAPVFKMVRKAVYREHGIALDAVAMVAHGSLPRTTSGKLRRSAAAEQWRDGTLDIVALDRATHGGEKRGTKVASALADALGIEEGDLDAWLPLVTRGVDSLRASALASTLERCGIHCPPAVLLAADTMEEIERACSPIQVEAPPAAGSGRDEDAVPLSEWQKPFWFAQATHPASTSNNVRLAITVRGDFDPALWSQAVSAVVARHEALWVTIENSANGVPQQKICKPAGTPTVITHATGWSEEQVEHHVASSLNAPFDLTRGPLFRSEILSTGGGHVLLFVAHHVGVDLWSMAAIFNEAVKEYGARRDGHSSGLAQPPRFRNFLAKNAADMERTREADLIYWRGALSRDYEVLDLPYDRAPLRHASEAGYRTHFKIDHADVEPLRALCARSSATLHMALLAIYRILLYRYTAQTDVLIGTPVSRRSGVDHDVIGCLINTVAIGCRVDNTSSFAEILVGVRRAMLDASLHADIPFHDVVREVGAARDNRQQAPLQTMFALQKVPSMPEAAPLIVGRAGEPVVIGGLALEAFPVRYIEVPFDLALMIAEGAECLWGCFEYRNAILDQRTVERFSGHFQRLLQHAIAHPNAPISSLAFLSGDDQGLLDRFQRGERNLAPAQSCVHWLIGEQTARTPDAVAIRWQLQDVTYRELEDRARGAAAALRRGRIACEDRIGVAMQPSANWVAAILAVWHVGGTVVSLDVATPPGRARDILHDASLKMVICDHHPPPALIDVFGARLREWDQLCEQGAPDFPLDRNEQDPRCAAYIAFTSGSAGNPKGVIITHAGASNFAVAQAARLDRAAVHRVLQIAPASFDAAFSDLFMSLTTGGTLCIAPPAARIPGRELAHFIRTERITLITATPSILATLEPKDYPDVAAVISMGETCMAESARRWTRYCTFYNGYGPTEASIGSTLGRFESAAVTSQGTVCIGAPFANYEVYVLDGDLHQAPLGIAGEVFVGGPGVARGYVNHPDWTAERFVPNPYGPPGGRMYRTGDRARWRADGGLEFLGRMDRQVKIRGVRIEPAEIEAALRALPAVRNCHVAAAPDAAGTQCLIAYVVGPAQTETADLIAFLRERLPAFMMPARFVCVDEIPVLPNGKIDARKLPLQRDSLAAEAAASQMERLLLQAWSEVLGFPVAGIDHTFFDLGGHSLLLHRLQAVVERLSGCSVALLDFFDYPTIRTFALHLSGPAVHTRNQQSMEPGSWSSPAQRPPIAIVGMAGRFPGAGDIGSFWQNIVSGKESITFFTAEELAAAGAAAADACFVPARGVVDGVEDFDAGFFAFSQREAEVLDPQRRILLELAQNALDDAGYAPAHEPMQNDVGVFVGTSRNSYFPNNVAAHPDVLRSLGQLKAGIAGDPGFTATTIAYKLNLSGPCVNVDTACSTSLVAVHQACQSLWAGECRMALAGGASIDVPTAGGHHFEQGMIGSPDGHCRAFDVHAEGTVKGMGAGLVVLKRLDAAVNDGDHIHAVIRGSAINNDGARKIGFTAPSADGQASVVRRALESAGIAPSALGYIEAHGTGTALGDPIEVAALNRALAGAPGQSIALGSVKSNIGHLDAASGVAGLIKCALVVSHALIPPQVHLQEPNPNIDWKSGPLWVPSRMLEWPALKSPRYAGVSSFGIGGTNAHLVLEEAPTAAAREEVRGPFLVPLSAGSANALRAMADTLADALRDSRAILADVAFTLAAGRRRLAWRTSVVCDSSEALVGHLMYRKWEPVAAAGMPPAVVVVFPGEETALDGSALAQMTREAPAFAAAVEECRALLHSELASHLDRVLGSGESNWPEIGTRFVYPALFVVEYAFWSFLRASGVRPRSLVAQGVGELVALCAAGAVSLSDGLDLAIEWGRLAEACPRSAMLAVGAAGRALHSTLVSSVGAPLSARAERIRWTQPDIPVCSSATGDWIGKPNAEHWTKVVAATHVLGDALVRAAGTEGAVAIEVGPSPSLLHILHGHPRFGPSNAHALACPAGSSRAYAHALRTLGRLWEMGVTIDLTAVVPPSRRISLPGVTFDRTRVWLDPVATAVAPERQPAPPLDGPQEDGTGNIVAEMWMKALGATGAAPDDEFFSSGGDSLLAITLSSQLGERLGIKLPPQVLFEHSTLREFGDRVAAISKPALPAAEETLGFTADERMPLSTEQRGLWLASQIEGAGASLNLLVGLRFQGPIDVDALQAAFRRLMVRYPILLHNFKLEREDVVQWRAHDPSELVVSIEAGDEATRDACMQRQANLPFSLATDLLLRATLLSGGGLDPVLIVTVHHLVADGWSLLLMLRDLGALYANPAADLPRVPSYADYIAAHTIAAETNTGRIDDAQRCLRDLPLVELPSTTTSPANPDDTAQSMTLNIDPRLSRRIRSGCRDHNLTLFHYLLAAFEVLVRRFIEDDEVVVASPITTRTASDQRGVVGPFVRQAVFRNRISMDQRYLEVAAGVRDAVGAALNPSAPSLEDGLRESGLYRTSRTESPFRIAFALNHSAPSSVRFGPMTTAEPIIPGRQRARHRIMMWIDEIGADLRCTLEYRTAFYGQDAIRRYLSAFERVLEAVTDNPGTKIKRIDILGDGDRRAIGKWNNTAAAGPFWDLVQVHIAGVAASAPHAPAIRCDGRVTNYGTLDAEARRVARLLLERGIAVEEPVGIFLDRGEESIIATLGVLYAGACYLPIDPELPAARIQQMVDASALRYVIASGRRLPDLRGVAPIDFREQPGPATAALSLPATVHPRNLAYILFTSGSTGAPKGVMVEHRALANRLDWMIKAFGFDHADRILHKTPISFDVSIWEILAPLAVGATVVIAKPGGHRDPAYLSALIVREAVTIVHFVPSLFQVFLEQALAAALRLRLVVCSGEVLRTDVYERACSWLGDRRKTVNLYGPTEAAIDVTAWVNEHNQPDIPVLIGRPIQNIRIHILDENLQTVPIGVTGELFIAGIGLARGYAGAPHLTADRFVPDPFGSGEVLYRSGDRARWTAGGDIEYRGRTDLQVKLRGMRIELGEIEATLREHPSVEDVAATVRGAGEHQRLAVHVVPERIAFGALHVALQQAEASRGNGLATAVLSNEGWIVTDGSDHERRLIAAVETSIALRGGHLPVIPSGSAVVDVGSGEGLFGVRVASGSGAPAIAISGEDLPAARRNADAAGCRLTISAVDRLRDTCRLAGVNGIALLRVGPNVDPGGFLASVDPEIFSSVACVEIEIAGDSSTQDVQRFLEGKGYSVTLAVASEGCLVAGRREGPEASLPVNGKPAVGGLALKSALRAYAAARLPKYMVPDEIVLISRMPVTQNGKLDREALAVDDPWTGHPSRPAPPLSPLESRLATVWIQILGGPQPDLESDFFESGGNSLLALRLVSAIEKDLGLEMQLQLLYEHSTLGRLAAALETAASTSELFNVEPRLAERFEPFPMSELQKAYAIGRSTAFQLGNVSTHGYLEMNARAIDRQRFADTLDRLIHRHDMLRAIVCGEGALQVLQEVERYEPPFSDLRSASPEETERAIAHIRSEMSKAVFDLGKWPLFEVRLTQIGEDLHLVHIAIDALIVDGASVVLLEREFNRLYLEDRALPAPRLLYRDFAMARQAHRSSAAYGKARAYWLARLDRLPEAPQLPLRTALESIQSPQFQRVDALLDLTAWRSLQKRAQARGLTPASILIAAYAEVLAMWSGEQHVLLNLPITNRPPIHEDVREVIGNFTSTMLLEADLRGTNGFVETARRMHRQLGADLGHLDFDGVELQRLRSRQHRTFGDAATPIVFTGLLGLAGDREASQEKPFDLGREVAGISRTSQVLLDCIAVDCAEGLIVNWDHVADAFPQGMISEMFDAYIGRLRSLAWSDGSWQTPLPAAPPPWRAPQLELAAGGLDGGNLLDPVLDAAERYASRIAVVSGAVELSYADLRALAGGVAATLQGEGMRRGDVVAIYAEKGWEQTVAAFGVLMAGGAYVPVEASLPAERRRRMLHDCGAKFVVTQPRLTGSLSDSECTIVVVTRDGPVDTTISAGAEPCHLAYIIFTSGSTGRPKGVAIEHGAAANTIVDINRRFGITAQDAVLCVSGLGFDLSVHDMFGLLSAGGKLVFPDADLQWDADHWWQLIERHKVTLWNTTPGLAAHLLAQAGNRAGAGTSLRLFLLSGDWIPLALPEQTRAAVPGAQVVSLGGATEAAIWSIFYPIGAVQREWKSIPYGRPLAGQDVVVLDRRHLEHCPTWVMGDIYIGGIGLARGYWNEPELTAKAFIVHPRWQARLYRTGDLGRYMPDGNIEFLGRNDSQVKLHGIRLELGEVESAIESHGGIDRAVVLADRNDSRAVRRLVAYVALAGNATGSGAAREIGMDSAACEAIWRSILAAPATLAGDEPVHLDGDSFTSFAQTLEGHYRAAVMHLFDGFKRFAVPGTCVAIDDLLREERIAPRYHRWLERAFSYLEAAGCVRRLPDDAYEVLTGVVPLRDAPDLSPGFPLIDVLREELHSAQLYSAAGTAASYQTYYRTCHRIATAIMEERIRAAGTAPLRVLEIGAGYGSLTEHVLPVLRARDSYLFTDVSKFFLTRAAELFVQYGFLAFDHFDMDVDPQLQGHPRHHYDVLIAASVLHNARHLPKTLAALKSMLAPGGLLLLIEETSFFPFFDLGMGLQKGFDNFDDPHRRDHPLLSREQWRQALADAGFVRSAVLNRAGTAEDAIGFDVVAAQAAEVARVLDTGEMVRHVEQFLPRSTVPSVWIQVDDFPLTANGKIDRRSLGLPRLAYEAEPRNYVAPRSETERMLAGIWSQAMGLTHVGALDDFFDLGGDSLVASRVITDLRKRWGIDMPLRALFDTTTVEALAALIDTVMLHPSDQGAPDGSVTGEL